MKHKNIPFSPPDMSEDEINEVADTLRNGWITTGPKVKEFERQIAEFVGVNKAVCLNSQTACAEMALRVLGVGEGDEVIVPAYTYTASASVVCHVGAKLVLVDVQKDNLKMDYDALEKAITEKTKVIIPVDLGGVPCDYDRIYEIIEKKKHLFKPSNKIQEAMGRISVNADTAHAFGASWHGKMCGSIADFSSFSFHAVKNLTTAEGGALTWRSIEGIDDEEIYKELQLLSLHGQSKDALAKTKLGAWEYDVVAPLYKCNMTDIMGGIGLAQMRRYPDFLSSAPWMRISALVSRHSAVQTANRSVPVIHDTSQTTQESAALRTLVFVRSDSMPPQESGSFCNSLLLPVVYIQDDIPTDRPPESPWHSASGSQCGAAENCSPQWRGSFLHDRRPSATHKPEFHE